MQQVSLNISLSDLKVMASKMFGDLVKAVVDVENKIMVVDAELHSDEEQFLLKQGSKQNNLWGINLHPNHFGTDRFVEFDSMINLRPSQDNPSRDVVNPELRKLILDIVTKQVTN